MLNYNEMKGNYETIKTFCKKYRTELIKFRGVLAESFDIATYDDYAKIMNELTDEEFVGDSLTALANEGSVTYRRILDGETTLDNFIKETYGDEIFNKYKERA